LKNEFQQIRNTKNNLKQRSSQIDIQLDSTDLDESNPIDELINREKEKFLQNQKLHYLKDITTTEVNLDPWNTFTTQPEILENNISDIISTDQSEDILSIQLSNQRNINPLDQHKCSTTTSNQSILRIGTHNIRGITRKTDQALIMKEIQERHLDIIGLSETKLTVDNQHFAFQNNSTYKCLSSVSKNNSRGSGVILLIHRDIEKFIASIDKIEGFLIAASFLTKDRKTWIAQLYLPCDKKRNLETQKAVKELIKSKIQKQFEVIIMGDFNDTLNPRLDRKSEFQTSLFAPSEEPEIELFRTMINWGFTDLHQLWEPENTSHTWRNKRSSSRIDYIWGSKEIALNLLSCKNDNIVEVTNSDHTLITFQIPRDTILRCPNKLIRHLKIKYEKIINTTKTTTAQ
jgi:exonuclease III